MNPDAQAIPEDDRRGIDAWKPYLKGLHVKDRLLQQHNLLKVLEKGDFLFVLLLGKTKWVGCLTIDCFFCHSN